MPTIPEIQKSIMQGNCWLAEVHLKGAPEPLVRPIAWLFEAEYNGTHGIVFTDVGWPEATWHPHHWLAGTPSDAGAAMMVGSHWILPAHQGIPEADGCGAWAEWLRTETGARFRDPKTAEIDAREWFGEDLR